MTSEEWIIYHGRYERYARPIFQRALKQSYQTILNNVSVINYDNYKAITTALLEIRPMNEAYSKVYTKVGLQHGKRIGREINRNEKQFNPFEFERDWFSSILEWMRTNLTQRITAVNEYTIELINNLVEYSLEQNYTITQMRIYLEKQLNSPKFNRMRSLRIARTETTTAANYGAFKAAENTGYEMIKEWISVMDDRTRHDHIIEDGQKVGQYESFIMADGSELLFPGDQTAPGKQVINCRCTYSFRAKRDSEGNIILR